jgi:subtilase family protein
VKRVRAAAVLGAVLTALSLPAAGGALEDAQIQADLELPTALEKHRGLDSSLAQLAEDAPPARMVRVEAVARGARRAELEAAIRAAGGSTSGRYGRLVEARLPARALERLAAHPAVRGLRSPVRPQPQVVSGQGIAATGAGAWQAAGTTGAGVEIAIVDVGFRGWRDRSAEGELPSPGQVTVADFCDGGLFEGPAADDHGTAVAEIVHEIAPAAKLHLVCVDTLTSLGEAKNYVVENDIPIVNHSVGWLNTSRGDGSGEAGSPDAIVADARAQGTLWVNAAGNYGELHWTGSFADPDHNDFHNFAGADEGIDVLLYTDGEACVYLKWDDWPATDQDFDLLLFRSSDDQLVAFSASVQNGSQEPFEELCYEDPGGLAGDYYLAIASDGATETPRFDLFVTDGQDLEHNVAAGSLVDPATSPAALAVGAACVHSGTLEDYSSRGPTIDGRTKPDLTGQDANSTVTYGDSSTCIGGFGGTSAATAHVTGAAALLKQAHPSFGPAELQAELESRASDLGPLGKDNSSGAGRLALGGAPPTPPSAPGNVALPTISGFFHMGQTLAATDGQWTTGPTLFLTFRWLRCDATGAACVAISGARSRTYVPSVADLDHQLRVRVTAFNAGGATQATSPATPKVQPPMQPPANVIRPSVAGAEQFGQVVSASSGAWSGSSPLTITIEWLRCGDTCAVIAGAASDTYQLGIEDIGMTVTVRVTATNPAGSASATSPGSSVILPPTPGLISPPTIAGNAVEGQTLTGTSGTWSFATTLAMQWRRCPSDGLTCSNIAGATGAGYTATRTDIGFRLHLTVTAANAAGSNSATSADSTVVAGVPGIGIPTPPPVPPNEEPRAQTRLIVLGFTRTPFAPRPGARFTLVLRVATRATSARAAARRVICSAKIAKRSLPAAAKSVRGGVARCAWAIPKNAAGKRLRSSIAVSEGVRSVRKSIVATVSRLRPR